MLNFFHSDNKKDEKSMVPDSRAITGEPIPSTSEKDCTESREPGSSGIINPSSSGSGARYYTFVEKKNKKKTKCYFIFHGNYSILSLNVIALWKLMLMQIQQLVPMILLQQPWPWLMRLHLLLLLQ